MNQLFAVIQVILFACGVQSMFAGDAEMTIYAFLAAMLAASLGDWAQAREES